MSTKNHQLCYVCVKEDEKENDVVISNGGTAVTSTTSPLLGNVTTGTMTSPQKQIPPSPLRQPVQQEEVVVQQQQQQQPSSIINNNIHSSFMKPLKKKKVAQQVPVVVVPVPPQIPPLDWKRCHEYMSKKSRFCRQEVIVGTLYCGNHTYIPLMNHNSTTTSTKKKNDNNNINNNGATNPTKENGNNEMMITQQNSEINSSSSSLFDKKEPNQQQEMMKQGTTSRTEMEMKIINNENINQHHINKNKKRKRICCPIDSTHTIFEDTIQKHILICPKALMQQKQQKQLYYQSNINTGGYGNKYYNIISMTDVEDNTYTIDSTTRRNDALMEQQQQPFEDQYNLISETNHPTMNYNNNNIEHQDAGDIDSDRYSKEHEELIRQWKKKPQQQYEGISSSSSSNINELSVLEYAKIIALRVLEVHQHLFVIPLPHKDDDTITTATNNYNNNNNHNKRNKSNSIIQTMNENDIINSIPLEDFSQNEMYHQQQIETTTENVHSALQHQQQQLLLPASLEQYRMKSGGIRHIHQQASMIGHVRRYVPTIFHDDNDHHNRNDDSQQQRIGNIQSQNHQEQQQSDHMKEAPSLCCLPVSLSSDAITTTTTVIEMGAGRGMTGLVIAGVIATASGTATAPTTTTIGTCVGSTDNVLTTNPSTCTPSSTILRSSSSSSNSQSTSVINHPQTQQQQQQQTRLIMVERDASRSRADKILRKAKKWNNNVETNIKPSNSSSSATTACGGTATTTSTTTSTTHSMKNGDTNVPKPYMNLSAIEWDRIQCDLSHVDMKAAVDNNTCHINNVTTICHKGLNSRNEENNISTPTTKSSQNFIVIAKHCCGVGTDLALKSLVPIKDQMILCMMATCCHGVCFWDDYVGRPYLANVMLSSKKDEGKTNPTTTTTHDDNNSDDSNRVLSNDAKRRPNQLTSFGPYEFEFLRLWSSGSVVSSSNKDHNADDDDDDHNNTRQPMTKLQQGGMNVNTKDNNTAVVVSVTEVVEALNLQCGVQGLGRACQRLIDYGRKEYIHHVLLQTTTTTTTTKETTTVLNGSATAAAMTTIPTVPEPVAKLVYYVPIDITPQNALLVGHR